ncbi:Crp/Fnr family transcriptional regulator [Motiliproteus sp. MSK22-1]|uniref:Crp/Fnr family transcriptional regulator n=1 Tax=Motiliproteus sp. MSK22-1 TaxID=1897630 RepID=UPI000978B69B|nr:Crp/Fnr family transcriptional regulator [Motiliproteus sp. MSK22-1]OMH27987.1 Crp/Fnr family transcriptional regulator [Motiliproteus sp. MSK22-1]
MDQLLQQRFPSLSRITDTVGQEVLSQARLLELPAGQVIFSPGDRCENYLLVVEGSVKVLGRSANGREIILYRIENAGSCVLTTSCLLSKDDYAAEGITETTVKAFAISRAAFKQGLEQSAGFRDFIFEAYGERLSALITLIQEVAFERIDLRLARYLCSQGVNRVELHCTHQELATELGSAREVVSRQLKAFEKQGWIRLGRGSIQLDDLKSLQALSDKN